METYIFYFEDSSWIGFDLSKEDFEKVKEVFISDRTHIVLDETIISKASVRYVTKYTPQEEPDSATPEHMEQEVYEYLRLLEREMKNGKVQENGF